MGTVSEDEETARVKRAEQEARALCAVLRRQARRPFVLEITGTPKAGKTTLIGMLDSFLRECGWRVHILKERAGECPLPMKGHFFFNTWTTGTMLAGLIDAVDREYDFVILDRGIFDSLIWLRLQREQSQVSPAEEAAFEAFVTLKRWRRLVDRVCVIEVDSATAMGRENSGRLRSRTGSVMNPPRLTAFNQSMRSLMAETSERFEFQCHKLDNSKSAKDGAINLVEDVLGAARTFCDPEIAVVSRDAAQRLIPNELELWSAGLQTQLIGAVTYHRRSEVEDSPDWVQLLACGVQTHAGEVFLAIRRPGRDEVPRPRDNTGLVWRGCHVEKPADGRTLDLDRLREQLKDRLRSDLHLGDLPATPEPRALLWTPGGDEQRHLGLMFEVQVPENIARSLDEKQFRTNGRGHRLESSFVSPSELATDRIGTKGYKLEQWSGLLLDRGLLAP